MVIERIAGVHDHPGHVWKILAGIEWSLQRPARQAPERNQEALQSGGKKESKRFQSSSAALAVIMPPTLPQSGRQRNKQVSAYGALGGVYGFEEDAFEAGPCYLYTRSSIHILTMLHRKRSDKKDCT